MEQVVSGSPADRAGIKRGDVITEWGGAKAKQREQVQRRVGRSDPGETMSVRLRRGAHESVDTTVTLADLTELVCTPSLHTRVCVCCMRWLCLLMKNRDGPQPPLLLAASVPSVFACSRTPLRLHTAPARPFSSPHTYPLPSRPPHPTASSLPVSPSLSPTRHTRRCSASRCCAPHCTHTHTHTHTRQMGL